MKTEWAKIPSITRPGLHFYRATINGTVITVLRSRLNQLWFYQRDKEPQTCDGSFKTPQEAQAEAEAKGVQP